VNDYVIIESGEEEKWQGQVRRRTDALETLGRDKLRARERLTFRIIRTDQGKEKWLRPWKPKTDEEVCALPRCRAPSSHPNATSSSLTDGIVHLLPTR